MLLGCIANDFTGTTDLANHLVPAGSRVVQTIGVPDAGAAAVAADAVDEAAIEALRQAFASW